jgi:hypothetical protein
MNTIKTALSHCSESVSCVLTKMFHSLVELGV